MGTLGAEDEVSEGAGGVLQTKTCSQKVGPRGSVVVPTCCQSEVSTALWGELGGLVPPRSQWRG